MLQRWAARECGHALRAAGIATVHTGDAGATEVDSVFVGWHPQCGMPDIEAACTAIWGGAKLYVASDVPFFATQQGRTIGYSFAITAAIRRLTARALYDPDRQARGGRAAFRRAQTGRADA